MPPPRDLTGQRFGKLVALVRATGAGETRWVCRCDCGSPDDTVPISRLSCADGPKAIRACSACRSRRCAVCGALYLKSGSAATCGADACRLEYRRAANLEIAHRVEQQRPGIHRERARQWRAAIQASPEKAAAWREYHREYKRAERERATETKRELRRAWERDYYRENRERVAQARARWIDEMPPDKRARFTELTRAASMRARRRKALAGLMADAAALLDQRGRSDDE